MFEGIDGALGRTGADNRMKLVDEQHDLAGSVRDLGEHSLQPLLELAAVLRAGDERAHVERHDPFVVEPFRHVTADDPLRQPFDDGGLAHAGLANQHRIVLRATGEHLDDAPNLFVATYHGVQFAPAPQLGQVAAVSFESLVRALRILRHDPLRTPNGREGLIYLVLRNTVLLQHPRGGGTPPLARDGDKQVLGADVFVLEPLGFGLCLCRDRSEARRRVWLSAAVDLRELFQLGPHGGNQHGRIDTQTANDLGNNAFALLE